MRVALRWATLGFAATCLLVSLVLGVYIATVATGPRCDGDACARLFASTDRLAWTVVGLAVFGIVVAVVGERLSTPLKWAARITVVAGAVWLVYAYRGAKIAAQRDAVAPLVPATLPPWLVAAAVVLCVSGLAAVVVASFGAPARPSWLAAAGVAAAVILTVILVAPVVQRPSDAASVSATTAAAVPIPPYPATVTGQRVTLSFEPRRQALRPVVQAAGAGFVTLELPDGGGAPTVVAYDASGVQRWHYSRTGPMPITSVSAVADVVLARASTRESALVIALDAITGDRLWSSDDPAVSTAAGAYFETSWYSAPHLVHTAGDRWTAFDPRSGRQTWSIANPLRCADGRRPTYDDPTGGSRSIRGGDVGETRFAYANTDDQLVTILDCTGDEGLDLRRISIDAATGELLGDDPVLVPKDGNPGVGVPDDFYVHAVDGGAYELTLYWRVEPQVVRRILVTPTGRMLDVGPRWHMAADGGFVVYDRDLVRQYSAAGALRCEFRVPADRLSDIAVLSEAIVFEDGQALHVVSRTDCRETAVLPLPAADESVGLVPVPGALLVTSYADDRVTVLGYS